VLRFCNFPEYSNAVILDKMRVCILRYHLKRMLNVGTNTTYLCRKLILTHSVPYKLNDVSLSHATSAKHIHQSFSADVHIVAHIS
jgi:hypothetical protein